MKKVNLMSRAEMKNVLGGIISMAVLEEVCLREYNRAASEELDPAAAQIIASLGPEGCYRFTHQPGQLPNNGGH